MFYINTVQCKLVKNLLTTLWPEYFVFVSKEKRNVLFLIHNSSQKFTKLGPWKPNSILNISVGIKRTLT
jgi:hypothetical protein